MIKDWSVSTRNLLALHWKRGLLFGGGGLLVILTIIQCFYPTGKLLPFASIEGVGLSGWSKADATKKLDVAYANTPLSIYFGDSPTAYRSPKPVEIGVGVSNKQRVNAMTYPWYLRLAPGSLLWAHWVVRTGDTPSYNRDGTALGKYITKELGDSCRVLPINAGLKVVDSKLGIEKSVNGGTCSIADVTKTLGTAQFKLLGSTSVNIPVELVAPDVSDVDARNLVNKIKLGIGDGIAVKAGAETVILPKDQLLSWLDFSVVEGTLDYMFNLERASGYLDTALAAKVAIAAGVTNVSTYDFVETSRQDGPSGQTLDKTVTLANLKASITDSSIVASAAVAATAPRVTYVRTYSPTNVGLSALMKHYGEGHAGTYGVALTELSGQYRRATYNSTQSFTAASTYKLFVAYSTLKRVEAGSWRWSDQIQGGRDLTTCFDDMIVKSDNACGEALLKKIGYTTITNEVRAIGCADTSFLGNDGIKTTPSDLALLLGMLQTGQVLSQQSSRDTLMNALTRNVYRQGIPAGATGSTVADKAGFLDGLLHDAAIVFAPSGPHILVIMTNGASWANIAELTRQIEALRIQ